MRPERGPVALLLGVGGLLAGCSGQISDPDGLQHDESNGAPASPDDDFEDSNLPVAYGATAGFGDPLGALTDRQRARFKAGKEAFEEEEGIAEGLGPIFNDTSCVGCHSDPATGGASTEFVTRFGAIDNGLFDPLAKEGGSLIQVQGIGIVDDCVFVGEDVPADATIVARRLTTPLFGLGLVDELDDETLRFIAQFEQENFPEEVGLLHQVGTSVGRFGWKAQVATLHTFAGDAYLNEMGITSPEFPDENCPQGDCSLLVCNPAPGLNDDGSDVQAFTDFIRFLAPPPRLFLGEQGQLGRDLFRDLGCNHCHWGTLRTGASLVDALDHVRFHPFSDFLLHDMGKLGDRIEQGQATSALMKTAPLWGLRARTRFLHDGRARSIEQAILAHEGQGERARKAFVELKAQERAALLEFLTKI
jgi:CxxC motif-containing protein (DUF1111 family)